MIVQAQKSPPAKPPRAPALGIAEVAAPRGEVPAPGAVEVAPGIAAAAPVAAPVAPAAALVASPVAAALAASTLVGMGTGASEATLSKRPSD